MRKALLMALVATLGWATTASAQSVPVEGKLYVDVNALYQAGSHSVDQRSTFSLYGEEGTIEARQRISGGALWDVGAGYTVWRDLAVGVDIAQFSRKQTMTVSGAAPHPLFFNSPRDFATDLRSSHKARTIAVLASWRIRGSGSLEKLGVRLMAGPALLHVSQGLVSGVTIAESGPPYSTVDASATIETASKDTVAFVGGADIAYSIRAHLGVGVLLRYAGGSVKFNQPLGGDTVTVKAGGFQVGGGVRLRF